MPYNASMSRIFRIDKYENLTSRGTHLSIFQTASVERERSVRKDSLHLGLVGTLS